MFCLVLSWIAQITKTVLLLKLFTFKIEKLLYTSLERAVSLCLSIYFTSECLCSLFWMIFEFSLLSLRRVQFSSFSETNRTRNTINMCLLVMQHHRYVQNLCHVTDNQRNMKFRIQNEWEHRYRYQVSRVSFITFIQSQEQIQKFF